MGNSNGVPTPHPHQIPFECGIRTGFKPHPRPEPDSNQVGLWGELYIFAPISLYRSTAELNHWHIKRLSKEAVHLSYGFLVRNTI